MDASSTEEFIAKVLQFLFYTTLSLSLSLLTQQFTQHKDVPLEIPTRVFSHEAVVADDRAERVIDLQHRSIKFLFVETDMCQFSRSFRGYNIHRGYNNRGWSQSIDPGNGGSSSPFARFVK